MKKSIRSKILLTVLAVSVGSIALVTAVTLVNLNNMRENVVTMSDTMGTQAAEDSTIAMEAQAMEQLTLIAAGKADYADEKMNKQQTYAYMVADYLQQLYTDPEAYTAREAYGPDPALEGELSPQLLYFNETIDPAAVADEVALTANTGDMLLSIARGDPDIECGYFAAASGFSLTVDDISGHKTEYLDCPTRGWYQQAMKAGDLIWTDVFEDAMGRGLAITCATPYRDGTGEIRGVVAFGSTINALSDKIIETEIGQTGYMFVVNENGQTIISPNIRRDEQGNLIRESLFDSDNRELRDIGRSIIARETGVKEVEFEGRQVYMAYHPMSVLPWSVVAVMDVEEAMAPAEDTRSNIEAITDGAVAGIDKSIYTVLMLVALVCVAAIAIVAFVSYAFAQKLTTPLSHLLEGVERISGGDLKTQIEVHTGDEIETLADAFNSMTANLEKYIHDLTAVTAEKERIGAELNVATQIQKDMLPNIFPAFPERQEFDIYASMDPAKEVGGDFYDFFMVDASHLAVVMADVSGKGVPAALFMVIAKTIIKNQALTGDPLGQVFERANDQLCENNGEGLFVTAFMGLLDLNTGDFTYVNAGHNAPLLRRKDGNYEYLQMEPGFVLAGLDGMQYESSHLKFGKGDTLFLYTDGVTEALNPNEELFGEDRLREALNDDRGRDLQVSKLLPYIRSALEEFARGAEQADDITMLGITYRGPGKEGES
ncbi:SpoIIE family protein phosphatase [Oscillibacter sp.]|uniref:SpoIIE family protein phosphatase n=1 Tax=Oscillibacter sp. TaxID=1945593 RepID=UPI001B520D2F|nr:SpoIIE family protein phosphatase [Oscillibacter sp.]MBP3509834.1 SpoIIE family protein phosphatase [Oscillibacter sp.]